MAGCPLASVAAISRCRLSLSDVRFTPESGHLQCTSPCPLWAISGHGELFDDLIGPGENSARDHEPKRLRGFEIDGQFKFYWLLDRQFTRLSPLNNFDNKCCRTSGEIGNIRPIRDEPSVVHILSCLVNRW